MITNPLSLPVGSGVINPVGSKYGTAVEIVEAPLKTHSFIPVDGAVSQQLDLIISWGSNNQAQTYDVYFGAVDPPSLVSENQKQRAYIPSLILGETYYVRVDSKNIIGTTEGDVISFSTWDATDIWTTDDGTPVTTDNGEYIEITK